MGEEVTIKSMSQLIQQKDKIEEEIEAAEAVLFQPGGMGLRGGLVDDEGYPIDDVGKILNTRELRNRLACLQTDHKLLMQKIEKNLFILHKKTKESDSHDPTNSPSPANPTPNPKERKIEEEKEEKEEEKEKEPETPLCFIQGVKPGSPACKAGLKKGDQVLQLGSLSSSFNFTSNKLDAVKKVVASCACSTLKVIVRRDEGVTSYEILLSDPPILGCHFVAELS